MKPNPRYKLICCEVFTREICHLISNCPNQIDVEFLPKGLHDLGSEGMLARLQVVFDRVDESLYEAVLFGYGLCNNGLAGIKARGIPVVVPRAHDCIAVFMGSRQKYESYFNENPGTYFLTSGWIERGEATGELSQLSISTQMGMNATWEELVEQYGEDNAEYLYETLVKPSDHYGKYTYIEMGVEPDDRFELIAQERAKDREWKFERMRGDLSILEKLLAGDWDPEIYLVVPPGHKIANSHDGNVVKAIPT